MLARTDADQLNSQHSPCVSVIVPAYNAGRYIEQAINSVLQQTFSNYEIIVVDDGSTDDTAGRLAQYGNKLRYIYQLNQERSVARNTGILASTGRYIAFLDADDVWHPEKLAHQILCAEQHSDASLIFSWAQAFIGEHRLPLILGQDFQDFGRLDILTGLLAGKALPTLTVLVDRSIAIETGLFDPDVVIIEDWNFWLRLSIRCKFAAVPRVLGYYRLSGKYLPAAMKSAGVPDARVKSVERVFREARKAPGLGLSSETEARALSQAWWIGCLIEYAVSDFDAGQHRLLRSIHLDRVFHLNNVDKWIQSLIAYASNLYDFGTPRVEAEAFLSAFFDNLPPEALNLRRRYPAALGWLKASYAFRMRELGLIAESRALMRQAISAHPPLLGNLGVISTALHNTWIDPKRAMHWLNVSSRDDSVGTTRR